MTTANKLTLLRIILVPVIWVLAISENPWMSFAAALVFVLVSITDMLDGYLARKNGEVTSLGKILDPVADKLAFFAAALPLMARGEVAGWMIMVFFGREILVSALRQVVVAQSGNVVAAKMWGKLKTVFQDIAVVVLLVTPLLPWLDKIWLGDILMWIAVILTIVSMVDYIVSSKDSIHWGVDKK